MSQVQEVMLRTCEMFIQMGSGPRHAQAIMTTAFGILGEESLKNCRPRTIVNMKRFHASSSFDAYLTQFIYIYALVYSGKFTYFKKKIGHQIIYTVIEMERSSVSLMGAGLFGQQSTKVGRIKEAESTNNVGRNRGWPKQRLAETSRKLHSGLNVFALFYF